MLANNHDMSAYVLMHPIILSHDGHDHNDILYSDKLMELNVFTYYMLMWMPYYTASERRLPSSTR